MGINDFSQLDLVGKDANEEGKKQVVQLTSFEEDITTGIQNAQDDKSFDDSPNELTYLKFKLNDGRVLNTSVNLEITTALDLKQRVFAKELAEGKVVRLLFMGKMLQDQQYLSTYKLKNMSFLHALISVPLNRPEGARPEEGRIEITDSKVGFDRFLRMRNKQYTDLQIHQMRLVFHSI